MPAKGSYSAFVSVPSPHTGDTLSTMTPTSVTMLTPPTHISLIMMIGMIDSASAAPPNKPSGPSSTATQNWDTVLPADQRFTVLPSFNNQAVRDNETGLVWERSPTRTRELGRCGQNLLAPQVGNRKGWRLPMIEELRVWWIRRSQLRGQNCRLDIHSRMSRTAALRTITGRPRRVFGAFLPTQAWVVRFHNGARR